MFRFEKYNVYPEDLSGQSVSMLVASRDSRRFPGKAKFLMLVHDFSESRTFFTFTVGGENIGEQRFDYLDQATEEFNSW